VISLLKSRCSADKISLLIVIVALGVSSWWVYQPKRHDWVLELAVPGTNHGFLLVAFLDLGLLIGIPEVISSISEISGSGIAFFT
jgi:hypothetical protein